MKAELIPFDGGPPIPITRDVTVLGRREYCDIQIDDPSLSKRHCVLVKTDGLLVIRDLATTNGTKVKGQKIRWAALLPEDRISFGNIKFRVYLGSDDVPTPSELAARGMAAPVKAAFGFAAPTPVPTPPPKRPAPMAPPRPNPDFDLPPLNLNEGAWRDALDSGIEIIDDEEIIELD
jgi:predicted component of type VI protein secretion system